MKVSIKQLAKLLMEEKKPLAKTEEEDTESFGKDFLSKSWGDDEEADPKLDFVDEARWNDLAGIVLSEQPVGPTGEEEKTVIEADAERLGNAAFDAIMDLMVERLQSSVGLGDMDVPHPAVYKTLMAALKNAATDLEVEMKEAHPPEFITLWEPGYGPGSA